MRNVRSCLADHHHQDNVVLALAVVDARFASSTCRPLNQSNFVCLSVRPLKYDVDDVN